MKMNAEEQVNRWFESLTEEDKAEIFAGLSPDPSLWWSNAGLKDKNDLMAFYGQRDTKPLGEIPEEK